MIIKDSMILIHLAKITLLGKSCKFFKSVIIPQKIFDEIVSGADKGYPDIKIITDLIAEKKITVRQVRNKNLVEKAREFNIQRGEGEAVALYWEKKANYLATDDDNVRKKSVMLNVKVIGTPAIILKLFREKLIKKEKFEESLSELRKIGWFNNAVIDKIMLEGQK